MKSHKKRDAFAVGFSTNSTEKIDLGHSWSFSSRGGKCLFFVIASGEGVKGLDGGLEQKGVENVLAVAISCNRWISHGQQKALVRRGGGKSRGEILDSCGRHGRIMRQKRCGGCN